MKILFIGGTGIISSACSQLAVEQGHSLTVLNRGETSRPLPPTVERIAADIRDEEAVREALGARTFDVVVNWIAFAPEHIATDLRLFTGGVGQYVFISSASAYQKPVRSLPITEETPLENPFWAYSRQKIACEQMLRNAFHADGFPATIVRPSHTYDATLLPFRGRWTIVDRMRRGKPIVVHGDGTSLWTLTHHRDFAVGFNGLLGHSGAIGEAVHITSDEWLTWDEIARQVGAAAGAEPIIVHIPSDTINSYDPEWGASLLGDKTHSVIFDNAKVKRLVPEYRATIPFAQGASEMIQWYESNPHAQRVDHDFDRLLDQIIEAQRQAAHP